MKVGSCLDVGHVRDRQEDALFVNKEAQAYAVIDAMGGQGAGVIIAGWIARLLEEFFSQEAQQPERFRGMREDLFLYIDAAKELEEFNYSGAASCSVLSIQGDWVVMTHVGSCRIYRLRDGELLQMTWDHTLCREYLNHGLLFEEGLASFPYSSVITSALLAHNISYFEMCHGTWRAKQGDRYLLCSDGVHKQMSDEQLKSILEQSERGVQELSELMMAQVLETEAQDNIAIMMLEVDEPLEPLSLPKGESVPYLDLFGTLRSLLHQHDEVSWREVTSLLARLQGDPAVPDEFLGRMFDYVEGQVKQWPKDVPRDVPFEWLAQWLEQSLPGERLKLCSRLKFPEGLCVDDARLIRALSTLDGALLEVDLGDFRITSQRVEAFWAGGVLSHSPAQDAVLACIPTLVLERLLQERALPLGCLDVLEDEWWAREKQRAASGQSLSLREEAMEQMQSLQRRKAEKR